MFTRFNHPSQRRLLSCLSTLLLLCGTAKGAAAQTTASAVTPSFATALTPPTGLGTIGQSAVDVYGDLVFVDHTNDAVYEYPVGGGAVITLVAPGGLANGYGSGANPGIVIDSQNAIYLEGNYSNCLLRFPYSPSTNSWPGLATLTMTTPSSNCAAPYNFAQYGLISNVSPNYFQPQALAIDANNNIFVTTQTSGANDSFLLPVVYSGSTATAGPVTSFVVSKSTEPSESAAIDRYGNYYVVENSGGPTGVVEIPAGSTNLASDTGLQRVDPNLPNVVGVTTDPAGNLYISDSKQGVYFVPNVSGTPQPSQAVLLTSLAATTQVALDPARGIMYVPTTNSSGSTLFEALALDVAALGTSATAAANTTSQTVTFTFNAGVTPGSFAIDEGGATTPDFTVASGGTCVAGTAQASQSSCTLNVLFSPHAAGEVSAELFMLDGSGNTLASIVLSGMGSGSAVQVLPGGEVALGAGLKTPTQVAADAGGNVYVADAGLGAVEEFPRGSTSAGTALGTGIVAPSGVAVDGAGDVFLADSGNVYEIPVGGSGLNAAGQVTVKTGLGTGLQLATDGAGHLYIADPANHRVIRLGNVGGSIGLYAQTETDFGGLNSPSAIAVDQNQNLYVADGTNLYEVTPAGVQTTVLTGLAGVTGLAVDPSGSVYYTASGTTFRVPFAGGALALGSQVAIATDVTAATSVALDPAQNLYIANAGTGNVDMVSSSASFNFGTLTSTTGSASQAFTLLDTGNLPLNVTGFSTPLNFSATATTCTGTPVSVDGTCSVTITFNPSPGQQGTLTDSVLVTGDEANIPVGVNGTGVGAALAASKTTATASTPTVDAAPVAVTVAAASGTGATPTGTVTVTATGNGLTTPATVSGTLTGGAVTLAPPQLPAGSYTFTVNYVGDRTYSGSSVTLNVMLAAGAVALIQPTMAQIQTALSSYPYILAAGAGSNEPYDGSVTQYEYTYPVTVMTADGAPLIGVPVYNTATPPKQVATNYGSISFTGVPAGSNCAPIPVAADGTASFSTDCLSINTTNSAIPNILDAYTLTPVYSPAGTGSSAGNTNPNYTMVTGSAIAFTALRNPMVAISSNPSSISVTAGSSATATLTLTSLLGYGIAGSGSLLNNYSLPLQLACDGLPAYATCSFTYANPDPTDPQSLDVGPAAGTMLQYRGAAAAPCTVAQGCVGPGTVVMTINTNIGTGSLVSLRRGGKSEAAYAAVFGLGLCGLAFGKRRSLRGRMLLSVCLLMCGGVMAGITGCSTTQLGASTTTVSPSGSYTVIVTAKQVGSQVITQTPGIVYGNQNQMSLPFTVNVTVQ